jgi:NAD(P)-dependent dehydrogenase (short-subunit alcohol dehydrogenase family)
MDPAGTVALVTGGARRVGRALALGLARAGADVVVHYHGSAREAADTVAAIQAEGRRAVAIRADLASADEAAPLIRAAAQALGRIDILVNNAALFERSPLDAITAQDWDRVLAVNLRAPFLLAQAAAPLLRERGAGVIVNIADLSAFQPWPSYAHHSVSKAGLVHLTRVLARALAPAIRANCIAPGTVLPPENMQEEEIVRDRERATVDRPGSPDDVVAALLYLVRADFVTGETLLVDGGRMLL